MRPRQRQAGQGALEFGGDPRLPLPGADVRLWPHWLDAGEADALMADLCAAVPWSRHRLRLFGREVQAPRLSCWIGDPGTAYVYSGTRFEPHPWTPSLQRLRTRLEAFCGQPFNSVLANLYRDGDDAMGAHSDDEPELGPRPCIASLSLGQPRRFRFRPRTGGGAGLAIELPHGSLLVMAGDTQRLYRHELPRTRRAPAARLNLTFRRIVAG